MIDIVIVNYNSTDHLLTCLDSVVTSLGSRNAGIFIQDNASSEDVECVVEKFPQVTLTRNRQNLGFAKAVNQGLRKCKAKYVCLLNPDTYVNDDFFDICIDFMEKNPDVGIMGSRILDTDGRLQNSARSFPTPLTAFFGRTSFLSRRFPRNPITSKNLLSLKSDGKTPMAVDWVSGASMIIRKKAIEEVGYLDERFFMYWEDADWCWRMGQAGWRVVYYPRPSVYHYVGGSSEKRMYRSLIAFHRSVYLLFEKHMHPSMTLLKPLVFGGLIIRLVLLLGAQFLRRTITENKVNSISVQKKSAPGDGYRHFSQFRSPQRKRLAHPDRIRVMRIISRMNIGGPAIHVHLLNKGLNPDRFESILVTGKISPREGDMSYLFDTDEIRPIIVPELQREISMLLDLKAFIRLFRILMTYRPHIVHTHTAKAGSSARFAAFLYNLFGGHRVIMVHTFHGHIFEGYFNRINSAIFVNIERILGKVSQAIIAISQTQKDDLTQKYRIADWKKVHIVELGFDLKPFLNCHQHKGWLRKKLGLSDQVLLVGIVGRLVPIKNHRMFFEAAKIFVQKHPDREVKFIVVGDGELREQQETFCRENGLDHYVVFTGWLKNVRYVYADLDILSLTSLNEGTPVSIIESMAAGVPVISTDAGGVQDLLGDPVDGLSPEQGFSIRQRGILCQKDDPMGLARGLAYMAHEAPDQSAKRISEAREFVKNRFNHHRLIQDIERLYVDLMTTSASS